MEASPEGAADELKRVLASVGSTTVSSCGGGTRMPACKEGGQPLNATERQLADTMECLSLAKIVELMKAARRERGLEMPRLASVVQVSAKDDRFVGRHSDELYELLKGLSAPPRAGAGSGGETTTCERRDITGGHISALFSRGEAIVPAIVAAFDKLRGDELPTPPKTTPPEPAPVPSRI